MAKYTLTERKFYDVDKLPKNIFKELDKQFPATESNSGLWHTYRFCPYRIDFAGAKRILSTEAKEVQNFIESL